MPEIKSKKIAVPGEFGPPDFLKSGVLWQTLFNMTLPHFSGGWGFAGPYANSLEYTRGIGLVSLEKRGEFRGCIANRY